MVLVIETPTGRFHSLDIHTALVTKAIDINVTRIPGDLHSVMVSVKAKVHNGQNSATVTISTLKPFIVLITMHKRRKYDYTTYFIIFL